MINKTNTLKVMTIKEIKNAVNAGKDVKVGNDLCKVIHDKEVDQWLIICSPNNHCIGLHGKKGTKFENQLNATDFYIKEPTKP